MTFWTDAADDLESILDDDDGPSVLMTHTPADGGATSSFPVILVSAGVDVAPDARRIVARAYFSRDDLAAPQYQDTLTSPTGGVWRMMRDAGSNGDMMRWEVEQDVRATFLAGQTRTVRP